MSESLRFSPFPTKEDRALLRLVFDELRDSFSPEETPGDRVLTPEERHSLWMAHMAPSPEVRSNLGFAMYWAWLCLRHEFPVLLWAGLSFIAVMGGGAAYYSVKGLLVTLLS